MLSPGSRIARWLALALQLSTSAAHAEDDVFGTGDGHAGAVTISRTDTVVNTYQLLTADAAAGSSQLTLLSSSGFLAGDLLLLVQFTGLEPAPDSGVATPIVLDGRQGIAPFEWARVSSVSALTLVLTQPLVSSHRAWVTQAVKVPEYTTLTIPPGGNANIVAQPWNGTTGGIIAILASGVVTLQGTIDASGRGFRGGLAAAPGTYVNTCGLDVDPAAAAMKGEGIVAGRFGQTQCGPGNVANAGGGASSCGSAGSGSGGSGAHLRGGAPGGGGGGGRGGAPVSYDLQSMLLPGGGGGAGLSPRMRCSGGAGGGVVLIRAQAIAGTGFIAANGAPASPACVEGIGGAGAGGAVSIKVQQTLACGAVSTVGGSSTGDQNGLRTAGGPGGRIVLQAASVQCAVDVRAGPSASFPVGGEPSSSDDVRYLGEAVVVGKAFAAPPAPALTEPAPEAIVTSPRLIVSGSGSPGLGLRVYVDGMPAADLSVTPDGTFHWPMTFDLAHGRHRFEAAQVDQGVSSARSPAVFVTVNLPWSLDGGPAEDAGLRLPPHFDSPPGTVASCGAPYRYSATEQPVVSGGRPLTFSIGALVGSALPPSLTVDTVSGRIQWVPAAEDRGSHAVVLRVDSPYGHDEQAFVIDVDCGESPAVKVACGCDAASLLLATGAAPLVWVLRRRRVRAPPEATSRRRRG